MFKCFFLFLYIFFSDYLPSSGLWRTHFWQYRHRFCAKQRVSVGIDFLGGPNFNTKIHPPPKPQKREFFGLRKYSPKTLYNGEAHQLSLIVTAAQPPESCKVNSQYGVGDFKYVVICDPHLPWVT